MLDSVDLSSLSDEELAAVTAGLKANLKAAKAERNSRNATGKPDALTARWRDKTGFEPLPAYDRFLYALDWQQRQHLKKSKKLARAVPIMLLRPELFIHCMEKSEPVKRLLYELRGWTVGQIIFGYPNVSFRPKADIELTAVCLPAVCRLANPAPLPHLLASKSQGQLGVVGLLACRAGRCPLAASSFR